MKELNDLMEFDHVIRVHTDGSITEPSGVHAPEIIVDTDDDGQILNAHEKQMIRNVRAQGWSLLTGYTGQHGYRGPIMHPSEFIGGRLEKDIRTTPGLYVAVIVTTLDAADDRDDVAGWAVAHQETT